MSEAEIRDACALIARTPSAYPHAAVATHLAATGAGAQERVDREAPKWGKPGGAGIGVAGDASTIADSIRRLAGVGVTSVVIQPCADEPDLEGFIRFLGRDVKPLLATS